MTEDIMCPDEPVARFTRNETGRDFVVGDIHGMFEHLARLLAEVEFDPESDRLFSVGDMVDRGPQSHRALEWLAQPWFHACRGNHEQFALEAADPEQCDVWVSHNGGAWWLELDDRTREHFVAQFGQMPIAMEIETDNGRVGIVHADVPPLMSWEEFLACLESGDADAINYAIWSRNRISGAYGSRPVLGGISRVFCGHTPTRDIVIVDNVCYIDTGAVYCLDGYVDAKLTLMQIHPGPARDFSVSTFDAEWLSRHVSAAAVQAKESPDDNR